MGPGLARAAPKISKLQANALGAEDRNDNSVASKFVEPSSVAISADGSQVIVGDRLGRIEFWDVNRAAMTSQQVAHSQAIVDIYILPLSNGNSSQNAISVSADGTIARWDLATAQEIGPKRLQHYAAIQNSALNANGSRLITSAIVGTNKSKLWLWDMENGELLQSQELQNELVQDWHLMNLILSPHLLQRLTQLTLRKRFGIGRAMVS